MKVCNGFFVGVVGGEPSIEFEDFDCNLTHMIKDCLFCPERPLNFWDKILLLKSFWNFMNEIKRRGYAQKQ